MGNVQEHSACISDKIERLYVAKQSTLVLQKLSKLEQVEPSHKKGNVRPHS
jgi:hypothetical protein